jgi:Transglutaminase-like superfamily
MTETTVSRAPVRQLTADAALEPIHRVSHSLVVCALWYMLLIDWRLTFTDFHSAHKWVVATAAHQWRRQPPSPDAAARTIREIRRAIQIASKFYYRSRKHCLPSAMLAYFLMKKRGLPVDLCLGVKKYPFRAHAWVEHDGQLVFTSPADIKKYTVIMKS